MAEVGTELLYGVLKPMQTRLAGVDGKIDQLKHDMQAMRLHMIGFQQEMSGTYATFVRHELRLDRIERRPELRDVSSL